MAVPDYPRLPPSYTYSAGASASVSAPAAVPSSTLPLPLALRAALALTVARHAAEEVFALGAAGGRVEGVLGETVEQLMEQVGEVKVSTGGVRVELEDVAEGSAPAGKQSAPLHLLAEHPDPHAVVLTLSYDSTLLPALEATWFLWHVVSSFSALLQSSPGTLLYTITLLSPNELSKITTLSQSPPPPAAYPASCTTLPSFFLHTASLTPHAPALQFDSTVLSYAQLLRLARFFAHHLVERGVKPGQIIPLCVDKSIEMIVSMLGILLAGCGYLNLEPKFPSARKEGIVRELEGEGLGAGVAVVQSGEKDTWSNWGEGTNASLRLVDPAEILGPLLERLNTLETNFPLPSVDLPASKATDAAYLIYTSGSTGVPKGIIVEHRNVAAFIRNYRGVFGRAPGERVLQFASYAFDVSVMNIWDTFAHGATLCMTSPSALLSDLAGTILRLECTLVDLTPTISTLLFEHAEAQPREGESVKDAWQRAGFRIKVLSTGGEKVEHWVRDAWLERGVRVVIDYGPSETTVGVISNQRTSTRSSVVPIGRPTGLNIIHILSSSLEIVPLGCIGEICVAGEQVTRGYVKKSLNEGIFVEHFTLGRIYRTGDLGRFLADGEGSIECLGRRDGQVKVNGLRIEVGEIEQHLTSTVHPFLSRGVVDKLESDTLSPGLVAFVVLSPSFSLLPSTFSEEVTILPLSSSNEFRQVVEETKAKLAQTLPAYMVPRYWICVNRIPTQGMGKADRKMLKLLAASHDFRRGTSAVAKAAKDDEWHLAVREAWSKVLRLDGGAIDRDDSFTKLGGDSIGFMRVIGLLRALGHHVSFSDLADASTLSECALAVQSSSHTISHPLPLYTPFSLVDPVARPAIFEELAAEFSINGSDVEDIYPTAPAQDALLAASVDSTHYYAQAIYALDASFPVEVVGSALAALVERYPVLRSCFVVLESVETTMQVVLASASELVQECVKLREVKVEGDAQQVVGDWLDEDRAAHVFRWGRLALSFAIFLCPDGSRKLAWSMHHAMSDGWTLELLSTDLRALCHGLDVVPRPPFANVVSWWNTTSRELTATAEFWRTYLSGAQPLNWPSRAPLNGAPLSTSTIKAGHWTGELTAFSKRHSVTPAIASRLAVAIALAHHAGSTDITLGVVRSGRDIDLDDADAIIGPCVSVLPTRLLLSPSSSLLSLAQKESLVDRRVRSHQLVTLSDLARLCSLKGRSDIFDILVTYQSLAERDEEDEVTRSRRWPIKQPPEQIRMPTSYTLSMEITPMEADKDALELACFYDARVISDDDVGKVLQTVAKVLDYLTIAPCTTLGQLDLGKAGKPVPVKEVEKGSPATFVEGRDLQPLIAQLAPIWASVLRMDAVDISPDESFGSAGGDSISMMRLSVRLTKVGLPIPVGALMGLATLREQAAWLAQRKEE